MAGDRRSRIDTEGACGHSQSELLTYYFANHPMASCPVFGELDVEPCEEHPIAKAIDEGYRYEERLSTDYKIVPRQFILSDT